MLDSHFLAMLALERSAKLDPATVAARLRRLRPDVLEPIEAHVASEGKADKFVISVGSAMLTVMVLDAPLPPGTLDQAIAGNFLWPDAARVLSKHRAHIIVANLLTPKDLAGRIRAAADVSSLCAAISTLTSCLGIYWVESESVIDAARFGGAAAKITNADWPIDVWVRLHFFNDTASGSQGTFGCVTNGLSAFVGREIEFQPAKLHPGIVAERVQGTILYILSNGDVLKHGDTFGISPIERIRIELADKGRHIRRPVFRLSLEAVDLSDKN